MKAPAKYASIILQLTCDEKHKHTPNSGSIYSSKSYTVLHQTRSTMNKLSQDIYMKVQNSLIDSPKKEIVTEIAKKQR